MSAVLVTAACGTPRVLQLSENDLQAALTLTEKTGRSFADSLQKEFRTLRQEMTETRKVFAETIPAAQASLTIAAQSLLELPEGAKFGSSEGRATVEAQRLGDSIVVTGKCDSIARQCEIYERMLASQQGIIYSLFQAIDSLESKASQQAFEMRSSSIEQETIAEPTTRKSRKGKWHSFLVGLLMGVICCVIVRIVWKQFKTGTIIS